MIKKQCSDAFAVNVYGVFTKKYSRATKIFTENYALEKNQVIWFLQTNQHAWMNYKAFIKLIDDFIVRTSGEKFNPDKHLDILENNYKKYSGKDIRSIRKRGQSA